MPVATRHNDYSYETEYEGDAAAQPAAVRSRNSRRAVPNSYQDDAVAVAPAPTRRSRSNAARSQARQERETYQPAAYDSPGQRARRRARRSHRPFQVSPSMAAIALALLAQLVALIWIKGLALSSMHRSVELGDATHGEIGQVNEAIAQTQKKIAILTSPTQIKKWADRRGWTLATPDKFDDVTKQTPPAAGKTTSQTDTTAPNNTAPNAAQGQDAE